jgi:long-chain acyl-CoA synthetase
MQKFNSPLEAFLYWETTVPNRVFLNQPINRKNSSYTFAEAGVEARKIASKLKSYKLPEHSHVALYQILLL